MDSGKQMIKSVQIHAACNKLWQLLTQPSFMKKWMLEDGVEMEISVSWKAGDPITMKGKIHSYETENSGVVLSFNPYSGFSYSHLSSLSGLKGSKEDFSVLSFSILPEKDDLILNLEISGFPTDEIYHHLDFYWNAALQKLKKLAESSEEI